MPSRVVGLPRVQAVEIARYERDSLGLRARHSEKCRREWLDARNKADLVVQNLVTGDDSAAGAAALRVGPAWKRAADCEGWPTPPVAAHRLPVVDGFTGAHLAAGALLGVLRATPRQSWAAGTVAVIWGVLRHRRDRSGVALAADVIAMEIGYFLVRPGR